MKKEFNGNGKGKRPIIGYNAKNWYANFDKISWNKENRVRRNSSLKSLKQHIDKENT